MKWRESFSSILLSMLFLFSCQKAGEAYPHEELNPDEIPIQQSDIKISIIGDSISTFAGFLASDTEGYEGAKYSAYYPHGNVNRVENTWWYKLTLLLGADINNLCNCSWSGSYVTGDSMSLTSASAGCSSKRILDLSAKGFVPDLVICYISCNDWANNVPIGNWSVTDPMPSEGTISNLREAYALMLCKIQTLYPETIIVCLTNLEDSKRDKTRGWPSNNSKGVTMEEWNNNIKEIACAMGCHIIDLQDTGINYDNVQKYTIDNGLHLNNSGMTLVAKTIAKDLIPLLKEKAPDLL